MVVRKSRQALPRILFTFAYAKCRFVLLTNTTINSDSLYHGNVLAVGVESVYSVQKQPILQLYIIFYLQHLSLREK